jgi:hypothetical protein
MLRFHHYGPLVLALAAAGCQKSAQQEQSEAINAQRAADQTAREAASERNKEVAEANREAAKEVAEAQRVAGKDTAEAQHDADEKARKAMADQAEKTSDAQRKANAETREAVDTTRKAQLDLRESVESKLNKLDERVRDLTKEAGEPKVAPATASSARQKLAQAEAEIKGLRGELPQIEKASGTSVEQFRTRADQRFSQIERTLDQVDDLL